MSARPPVIVLGMHRAGTSMVARLLEELGLFLGKKKDSNGEAWFFSRLNEWLLRQCGGAWDNPEPIHYLLENSRVRALAADYLRHMMASPRVVSYLGWGKYLRYRSPAYLDIPWGWKDPRSTFTLPLWLDLFPEAKVVHVYRHGVDVASSLSTRVNKRLAGAEALHEKRKKWRLYWLHPKHGGFADTLRCVSLEDGFSLWESYLEQARDQVRRLADRAIEVRYEDFVAEPQSKLADLACFCGLVTGDVAVARLASQVEQNRAYAYRADPRLQSFAASVGERLARWGY